MTKQDKLKQKLVELLQVMPVVEAAVKRAGVARSTYYRWLENDPEFERLSQRAIEHSRDIVNDMAESQLIAGIRGKNLTAIMFWLKHNHPSYHNKLELSGKVETTSQTLTPEQEELVKQALINAGLIKEQSSNENTK